MKKALYSLSVLAILTLGTAQVAFGQTYVSVRSGQELLVVRNPSIPKTLITDDAAISLPHGYAYVKAKSHGGYKVLGHSHGAAFSISSTRKKAVRREKLLSACERFEQKNPNYWCEINSLFFAKATPNDPSYTVTYGLAQISLPAAWDITTGSRDVKVAVVDTGVDYNHKDLKENIGLNSAEIPDNGIDDDANGYVDDYYGYDFVDGDTTPLDLNEHGTHVSGTIGAVGNDSVGICGVNWQVGIVPVRVLDASGAGSLADVASGIDYAVARKVTAVNLSLGGSSSSRVLKVSSRRALAGDVMLAVAAGNEGSNNDSFPSYPANYPYDNIISVAATDDADILASFSNYGATTVDVAAPGVNIYSTIPSNRYQFLDGTSMAAPHVAGLVALVKSANLALGSLDIRNTILSTADKIDGLAGSSVTGARINAFAAVSAASAASPQPTPDADLSDPALAGAAITLRRGALASKSTTISGTLYNRSTLAGIAGKQLTLYCNERALASATTLDNGTFKFGKITRPRSGGARFCYASSSDDTLISNQVTVKAQGKR